MNRKRKSHSFPDRGQWRAWLRANHEMSPGIWLELTEGRAFALSLEEAVEEALCFGWTDSLSTRTEGENRFRLFIPRPPGSPWSEADRERAVDLIARGCMTPSGMEQVRRARESGIWYSRPPGGEVMPEELENALEQNPGAAVFFAGLEPSLRNRYMALAAAGETPEARRKTALEIAARLERGERLPGT